MVIYRLGLPYYKEFDNFLFANLPFERGEIPFSKGFSVYTDIRKLQDKAKTSYTLSTRRLRFMSQTAQCLRHISHEPGVHSAQWEQ